MDARDFFVTEFSHLSGGRAPYLWQENLFECLTSGTYPRLVCLPTGLGKTSLMTVWLTALAWESCSGQPRTIPLRLVWVVDRRVVVDQATQLAEELADRVVGRALLEEPLRNLCGDTNCEVPLGVSTLRGERADNRDWSRDPSKPSIVIGTVDMIGSRLLFSGYGDGPWYRPQHAGLLGQDSLIVNDESHLTPAFARLIEAIRRMQESGGGSRNAKTMLLSATPSRADLAWPKSIESELAHESFRKRYLGRKTLFLHSIASRKDADRKTFELATAQGGGARRLIFVREPERALSLKRELEEKGGAGHVCLLTGTMRGWERDRLRQDPVFQMFQKEEPPLSPCYVVATSAGEVGVDISADLMVTDLDSAGHLVQRFGRLNRLGTSDGVAYLVYLGDGDAKKPWLRETLQYLRGLAGTETGGYDISCSSLHEHPAGKECEPPEAGFALLPERAVDLWAQTSHDRRSARRSKSFAVPDVAPWLHGKEEEGWPETVIAWREDVTLLARQNVDWDEVRVALGKHRILAREKLKEPTSRAAEKLAALANLAPDARVLCIFRDGSVEAAFLREMAVGRLEYATVILPPGVGRLMNGMFLAEIPAEDDVTEYDVADREDGAPDTRARYLVTLEDDGRAIFEPVGSSRAAERLDSTNATEIFERFQMKTAARVAIPPVEGDAENQDRQFIYYLRKPKPKESTRKGEVFLNDHHREVKEMAAKMAEKLGLQEHVQTAMKIAGEYHDCGKAREVWQTAAGNKGATPVAKPSKTFSPKLLGGFRHEFASLVDAQRPGEVDEKTWDLTLHLIASHHGWARPFFPPRAFDRSNWSKSEDLANECVLRHGRMQDEFGHWGLAYLEAVFKAADAMASQGLVEQPEDQPDGE